MCKSCSWFILLSAVGIIGFTLKIFYYENFKHVPKYRKKYKEPSCIPHPTSTIKNKWDSLISSVYFPPPLPMDNFRAYPRHTLFHL